MDQYRSSVRCKYCRHYRDHSGVCCYMGIKRSTSPNNVCKNFGLDDMEVIIYHSLSSSSQLNRRRDGSYIATIEDVPSLKAEFEYECQQEELQKQQRKLRIILLICGLAFAYLLFFAFIFG